MKRKRWWSARRKPKDVVCKYCHSGIGALEVGDYDTKLGFSQADYYHQKCHDAEWGRAAILRRYMERRVHQS